MTDDGYPIFVYDSEDLTVQLCTGPTAGQLQGVIATAANEIYAREICKALDLLNGIGTARR